MERLDALVAGVGVLVVAVALAGVVLSGPGEGTRAFQVLFPERREAIRLESSSASVEGDGVADVEVPVALANLTRLEVRVRVAGQGPRAGPDAIEATLESPDGQRESQRATLPGPGAAAEATLTFERALARAPGAQTVVARSEEQALERVAGFATTNGTGTWTLTVAVRGEVGPLHREAHTVTVEAAGAAFEAVVQPSGAEER